MLCFGRRPSSRFLSADFLQHHQHQQSTTSSFVVSSNMLRSGTISSHKTGSSIQSVEAGFLQTNETLLRPVLWVHASILVAVNFNCLYTTLRRPVTALLNHYSSWPYLRTSAGSFELESRLRGIIGLEVGTSSIANSTRAKSFLLILTHFSSVIGLILKRGAD
jgi:hypothetical protein